MRDSSLHNIFAHIFYICVVYEQNVDMCKSGTYMYIYSATSTYKSTHSYIYKQIGIENVHVCFENSWYKYMRTEKMYALGILLTNSVVQT